MEKEREQVLKILDSSKYDLHFRIDITRITRNPTSSENMRKVGNSQFMKEFHDARSHDSAWRFYTISISSAEPNSEALALCYGNRSAILIHLSKYEESIKDIDTALSITKNTLLRVKLLIRKAKCLYCLNSEESHDVMRKAEFLFKQITDDSIKKALGDTMEKTRLLLQKPNQSIPRRIDKKQQRLESLIQKNPINDFSAVQIQYSEQYGRHLVANKDFRPGDIIFIEQPFIQCLNLGNMHGICSHCFSVSWTNIPCDHCSWAMFCSEKCKEEAWENYHSIECSIYACAKQNGNSGPYQLALKAIILGLKKYGSLDNFKTALESFDECTDINKGFVKDGKIQPDGLMAMYSLSRNISKRSSKVHKVETARTLKSVGMNTTWFGAYFDHFKTKNYRTNENAILFGTLFLTFSKIGQINSRQMWNYRQNPCHSNPGVMICPPEEECCSAGFYLAPVTSLLNHNCWSNARVCYGSNNTVIVYATQPIKKGQQIFDCYTLHFYEEDITKRRKLLSNRYNIECDCKSCQEKWPFGDDFLTYSENKLKKNRLEEQLFKKHGKIIMSGVACCQDKKCNYDEKVISVLRNDIEKALKTIPQPSFTTTSLIHTLQKIFEAIYGISLDVPEKCNNI